MRARTASGMIASGFVLLLALLVVLPTTANGDVCYDPYTVQPGDTISSIARRSGITYVEILRLNPILRSNPNPLQAGQSLCLSDSPNRGGSVSPWRGSPGNAAIEVTYQFTPSVDENGVGILTGRNGQVGKRITYPLSRLSNSSMFSLPQHIGDAILLQPPPLLLAVRQGEAATYTLVYIGEQGKKAMNSLQFSSTLPLAVTDECGGVAIDEVLTDPNVMDVEVTLWLESRSGQRYPFPIEKLNYQPDEWGAADCYGTPDFMGYYVGLILRPNRHMVGMPPTSYSAQFLLNNNMIGPPGLPWSARCRDWSTKHGLFYRWLRAFARC